MRAGPEIYVTGKTGKSALTTALITGEAIKDGMEQVVDVACATFDRDGIMAALRVLDAGRHLLGQALFQKIEVASGGDTGQVATGIHAMVKGGLTIAEAATRCRKEFCRRRRLQLGEQGWIG